MHDFETLVYRIKYYIEKNSKFTVVSICEEASYENRKILRIDLEPEFSIHVGTSDYNNITDNSLAEILELIKKGTK